MFSKENVKNMKINSKNSETLNLHHGKWICVNKKTFGSFRVGPKKTWLQMGCLP